MTADSTDTATADGMVNDVSLVVDVANCQLPIANYRGVL